MKATLTLLAVLATPLLPAQIILQKNELHGLVRARVILGDTNPDIQATHTSRSLSNASLNLVADTGTIPLTNPNPESTQIGSASAFASYIGESNFDPSTSTFSMNLTATLENTKVGGPIGGLANVGAELGITRAHHLIFTTTAPLDYTFSGSLTANGTTVAGSHSIRFRETDGFPVIAFVTSSNPVQGPLTGTLPAGSYEITLTPFTDNIGNNNDSRTRSGQYSLSLTDPANSDQPATLVTADVAPTITACAFEDEQFTLTIDPGTTTTFTIERSPTLTSPWTPVSIEQNTTDFTDLDNLPKAFYRITAPSGS